MTSEHLLSANLTTREYVFELPKREKLIPRKYQRLQYCFCYCMIRRVSLPSIGLTERAAVVAARQPETKEWRKLALSVSLVMPWKERKQYEIGQTIAFHIPQWLCHGAPEGPDIMAWGLWNMCVIFQFYQTTFSWLKQVIKNLKLCLYPQMFFDMWKSYTI